MAVLLSSERPATASRALVLLKNAVEQIKRHPLLFLGGGILSAVTIAAVAAPLLWTVDPTALYPTNRLKPPDAENWFGTDAMGRDLYSRTLFGARISLIVGGTVTISAVIIGLFLGLLSGFSRIVDVVIMRVMDGLMAIPSILLAIALMALAGASVVNVIAAITVVEVPRVVRVVRSVVLMLRDQPYVEAAISTGTRLPALLWRHILPNTLPPLMVQATYIFGASMLVEATLSFLGAGTPPEIPTWGNIIVQGRAVFQISPYSIFFPSVFLTLTVLAVNLIGDGLRDALDPRLSRLL